MASLKTSRQIDLFLLARGLDIDKPYSVCSRDEAYKQSVYSGEKLEPTLTVVKDKCVRHPMRTVAKHVGKKFIHPKLAMEARYV